jgi:acyl-coenzyme A thioesterase PaaI-like protein
MNKKTRQASPLYDRVQRTLAINRKAKLTFPFVFMGLTGRQLGDDDIVLEFQDDAPFRNGKGELAWSALGMLADGAIGAVSRMKAGPRVRPVTAHLDMQMTGALTRGRVSTHGHFVGFSEGDRVRQLLATATLECGENLIGHASAVFMLLDLPEGESQPPQAWVPEGLEAESIDAIVFDSSERDALRSCKRAEAAATNEFPFIEHFWCGIPKRAEGKAHLSVRVTPHLVNRAGHAHGGLLLGTAVRVANAAVPSNMRLSNISCWFLRPGLGPRLKVRSTVVQPGRNLALVRTQITGASGKVVLDATSQHALLA